MYISVTRRFVLCISVSSVAEVRSASAVVVVVKPHRHA